METSWARLQSVINQVCEFHSQVADPGADDTILCEESAIISNQQVAV